MSAKQIIYSQFNRPKTLPCKSGSKFLNKYQETIKEGIRSLIPIGKTNVYDIIQSHAKEGDVKWIIAQFSKGNLEVLRKGDPVYADATTMPKSLMEAQNLCLRMKQEFEEMPSDVKKLFNYSSDLYIEKMGTNEFKEIMKPYSEKVAKVAEEKSAAEYERKIKEGAKLNYDIRREEEAMKALGGGTDEQKH